MECPSSDDMLFERDEAPKSSQESLTSAAQHSWRISGEPEIKSDPFSPLTVYDDGIDDMLIDNTILDEYHPPMKEEKVVDDSSFSFPLQSLSYLSPIPSSNSLQLEASPPAEESGIPDERIPIIKKEDLCSLRITLKDEEPSVKDVKPNRKPSHVVLPSGERNKDWIIARIEEVFESMADVLLAQKGTFSIALRSRRPNPNSAELEIRYRKLRFPGKSAQEAWRFTVVIRILELIHDSLNHDTIITKRDIYYRHPALFSSQSVVDRYVDDLACTWGVPRALLNVTAAAKGLVAGAFRILKEDGSISDGLADKEGMLITSLKPSESMDVSSVKWILVIEKEATFRSLASSTFWLDVLDGGVLITGKGYPDLATRALMKSLSVPTARNGFYRIPTFALVDYDPDGLAIFSTYKHGSMALAHESALTLPDIQWLGLKSAHVADGESVHAEQGLLQLTARDRRKAIRMLERGFGGDDDDMFRRELQVMLMLNLKAEIQLVDSVEGGLVNLLKEELPLSER